MTLNKIVCYTAFGAAITSIVMAILHHADGEYLQSMSTAVPAIFWLLISIHYEKKP